MNNLKFNILRLLMEGRNFSTDDFGKLLFRDCREVKAVYSELEREGFINEGILTSKAEDLLESRRINNAVILAAGMSKRFAPLNFEMPKGLLSVKGEVLVERQIKQLLEKGINEIVIVTGHMKEHFEYLNGKFGAILIEAHDYAEKNNHASVYAARNYLNRTIISSSDLYFTENIFQAYAYDSFYCVDYAQGPTTERGVITDNDDKIIETMYGCHDTWVTLGYAFFDERFTGNFLSIMEKEFSRPETAGKFWADIQDEHYDELYMYAKKCKPGVIHEFDSLEELRQFDERYAYDSGSYIMRGICGELGANEDEITEISPLTQSTFKFTYNDKNYCCEVDIDLPKNFRLWRI